MSVRRSKSMPYRVQYRTVGPSGEEEPLHRLTAMKRLRRSFRSLKASLKLSSGGQSHTGTPYDLSNRFHSQGIAAGGSALLDAINRGKVHLAKFILDAGEEDIVNTRDFKGKTPLIRACYIKEEKTRAKAIDLLLSKGADVNVQDDKGRTALSYACELRCNDVVKVLFKNNVDPDIADVDGNTALIYSAMVGNDIGVEILIRSFRRLGLNVDHVNNEGLNALLISAKNGFIECASILALEGKACISFRDREKGMNAEEWARAQGCLTPEVTAFSTKTAFMNYRLPDESAGNASASNVAARKISNLTRAHCSVVSSPSTSNSKPQQSSSKVLKDNDMERINKKLTQLNARPTDNRNNSRLQVVEPYSNRAKDKRRSLPSIKFLGVACNSSEPPKKTSDNAKVTSPKTDNKGNSGPLTPEGVRKHRRKSASKQSQLSAEGETGGEIAPSLPPPSPSSGMRYDYEMSSRQQQGSCEQRLPLSPKSPRSPQGSLVVIKDNELTAAASAAMGRPPRSPTLTSASAVQIAVDCDTPEPVSVHIHKKDSSEQKTPTVQKTSVLIHHQLQPKAVK